MIRRALGCGVAFGCLMASASLQAHHSTAGVYDPGKEVKVTGALAKLQFVNPHGSIVVTVKNADGTTTDWTFTTGSATALASQGITKVGPKAQSIGGPQVAYASGWNGPRQRRRQLSEPGGDHYGFSDKNDVHTSRPR